MKFSKKIIVASFLGVGATGVITATALAATSNSSTTYPPLVQNIANKFHLNPADVQGVFRQTRQDRQTARHQDLKNTFDQAVKDGKLTQDQENKLIDELNKLRDERKNDIKTDRKTDRQKFHDELSQWAKNNGITNLDQILPAPPAHMEMSGQ